jgi:hypothetical protein
MIDRQSDGTGRNAGWIDLTRELDCWARAGRVADLWWRDDDAATASPALDRLLTAAAGAPLALAVIPAAADSSLAARLRRAPQVGALQHGWRHVNHGGNSKKSEFPAARGAAAVSADLVRGRSRLVELFADRALPVLAPPWNRLDDAYLPLLADCGIRGISRIKPRASRWPAPRLFAANVHVDLTDWHAGRGFVGEGRALAGIVAHLQVRRHGDADPDEPTGILTHHLDLDDAGEAFLRRLAAAVAAHPAARWRGICEVFGEAFEKGEDRAGRA